MDKQYLKKKKKWLNKNRLKTLLHACFCRDKKAAKDYTKKKVGKEIRVLRNWSGLYRMIRSWHRMIRSWLILNPFSRILQKLFQSIVTFTLTRLLAPLLLVMRDRCNRRTIQTIRERSHQKLSRLLGQPSQSLISNIYVTNTMAPHIFWNLWWSACFD